jgi:hypothetical protein
VGKVTMAELLRWNPFDELRRLTETFDRLANRWRSGSAWVASPTYASVNGVDDGYRIRIPLPGISPENVTVDVTGRTVHVRAIERDGDTEVSRYEEVLTPNNLTTECEGDSILRDVRRVDVDAVHECPACLNSRRVVGLLLHRIRCLLR